MFFLQARTPLRSKKLNSVCRHLEYAADIICLSFVMFSYAGFPRFTSRAFLFFVRGSDARKHGALAFVYDTTGAWYSLRKQIVEL